MLSYIYTPTLANCPTSPTKNIRMNVIPSSGFQVGLFQDVFPYRGCMPFDPIFAKCPAILNLLYLNSGTKIVAKYKFIYMGNKFKT